MLAQVVAGSSQARGSGPVWAATVSRLGAGYGQWGRIAYRGALGSGRPFRVGRSRLGGMPPRPSKRRVRKQASPSARLSGRLGQEQAPACGAGDRGSAGGNQGGGERHHQGLAGGARPCPGDGAHPAGDDRSAQHRHRSAAGSAGHQQGCVVGGPCRDGQRGEALREREVGGPPQGAGTSSGVISGGPEPCTGPRTGTRSPPPGTTRLHLQAAACGRRDPASLHRLRDPPPGGSGGTGYPLNVVASPPVARDS